MLLAVHLNHCRLMRLQKLKNLSKQMRSGQQSYLLKVQPQVHLLLDRYCRALQNLLPANMSQGRLENWRQSRSCLDLWPNITGEFGLRMWGSSGILSHNETGVFSDRQTETSDTMVVASLNIMRGEQYIVFDASDGNSIYSGTKVQQSALNVLPCIRL